MLSPRRHARRSGWPPSLTAAPTAPTYPPRLPRRRWMAPIGRRLRDDGGLRAGEGHGGGRDGGRDGGPGGGLSGGLDVDHVGGRDVGPPEDPDVDPFLSLVADLDEDPVEGPGGGRTGGRGLDPPANPGVDGGGPVRPHGTFRCRWRCTFFQTSS